MYRLPHATAAPSHIRIPVSGDHPKQTTSNSLCSCLRLLGTQMKTDSWQLSIWAFASSLPDLTWTGILKVRERQTGSPSKQGKNKMGGALDVKPKDLGAPGRAGGESFHAVVKTERSSGGGEQRDSAICEKKLKSVSSLEMHIERIERRWT